MHPHHPSCPESRGRIAGKGKPVGVCVVCERYIYQGERCYTNGNGTVCEECIEYIGVDELSTLCDFDGREELIFALGFSRCDTN